MSKPGPSSSERNVHASKCAGSRHRSGLMGGGGVQFEETIVLQRQREKKKKKGHVWVRRALVVLFHTLSTMVMSRHITIYRVISVN